MRIARRALLVSLGGLAILSSHRVARAVTCGTDSVWCVDDAGAGAAFTTSPLGLSGYGLPNLYVGAGKNLVAVTEASGASVFAGGDELFGTSISTAVTPIWWNATPTGTAAYFATTDGNVHSINATTGAANWTKSIARGGCQDQVTGPIAVNIGASLIYVATNDDPTCALGQNRVYALNASDGSVAWTFNPSPYATNVGILKYGVHPDIYRDPVCTTAPANTTGRNQVIVADAAGVTYVLDASSGARLNAGAPTLLTNPGSVYQPQFTGVVCGASYVADNGTLGANQGKIFQLSIDPTYCGGAANTPCTIPGEVYTGPYTSPIQFSVARGAGSSAADRFLVNDASGVLHVSSTVGAARCTYQPASGGSVTGIPFEIGGVAYTETTEGSIVGIPAGASQKTDNSACVGYQERFFSAATTSVGSNPSVDFFGGAYALYAGDQAGRMASITAPFSATYTDVLNVKGFPYYVGPLTVTANGNTGSAPSNGIAYVNGFSSATFTPTATLGALTCTAVPATQTPAVAQDGFATLTCACAAAGSTLTAQNTFPAGNNAIATAIADFNGDGKPDVAVANNNSSNVSILLGNGAGSFSAASGSPIAGGSQPRVVAAADVNSDGKADLVIADLGTTTMTLMLGNGDGTFTAGTAPNAGGAQLGVAIGDLNADGKPDIVTANYSANTIGVLIGAGSGTFAAATTLAAGGAPVNLQVADLNADGAPDITYVNQAGTVKILFGSTSSRGTFPTSSSYSIGSNLYWVSVGDFDGDRRPDLAVLNNAGPGTVYIYIQTHSPAAAGSFNAPSSVTVGNGPISLSVSDFNGDTNLDIAVVNGGSNNVGLLLGNGSGGFGTMTTSSVGGAPYILSGGDLNGDGTPDLVVANQNTNNVSVLLDVGGCSPLVAWYPMDGNLNDNLGSGNNGTLNGGTTYTTDRFGNPTGALFFNASTTSATITNAAFPQGSSARSMSIWFTAAAGGSGWGDTFNYGTFSGPSSPGERFGLLVGSGAKEYFVGEYEDVSGQSVWSINTWHNLIVTYAGGAGLVQMYLDGAPTAATATYTLSTTGFTGLLGQSIGGGENFGGSLDDLRVFNRVLTPTEIGALDGCVANVTNTSSSLANCGACGAACSLNNITPACGAGTCNGACNAGFGDCNANKLTDGCETNTTNNVNNCNGCGIVCSTANATTGCSGSACNIASCTGTFANCDGTYADGCEINLANTPADCGGCGVACSSNNIAAPACGGGICNGACNTGTADCNANKQSDGCEINTTNNPNDCNGCGIVCSTANATTGCASSTCNIASCTGSFKDCNSTYADGCEINTFTSANNCGGCGTNCSNNNIGTPTCSSGFCNGACNLGFADCDSNKLNNGCEINTTTNTANCGACGTVCSSNNIATPTCGASVCNGACNAGTADCNANKQTDGCEVRLTDNFTNCGSCGHSCTAGQACIDSTCVTGPTGIVAWYPMQGELIDALGVGSKGTLTNATLVNDRFGAAASALSFSGSATSFGTLVDTAIPSGGAARTMSVWFNSTVGTLQNAPLLNYGQLVTGDRFGYLVNNNSNGTFREYFVGQNDDIPGNLVWSSGTWHNLVATYAGGTGGLVQMYLDGVVNPGTINPTLTTTAVSSTWPMVLGQAVQTASNDGFYNGSLSDFRMYNTVLTNAQLVGLSSAGQWLFDEGAGTTTNDTSDNLGAIDNGTLSSATWTTTGCHSGDCFDPRNVTVTVPNSAPLQFGTGPFTASAWINPANTTGNGIILGGGRCGDSESWLLQLSSGNLFLYSLGTGGTGTLAAAAPPVGTWHLVTVVRNGTSFALYVDNALAASTNSLGSNWNANAGGPTMALGSQTAGSCGAGSPFPGLIDSIRFYSLALPSSMINTAVLN